MWLVGGAFGAIEIGGSTLGLGGERRDAIVHRFVHRLMCASIGAAFFASLALAAGTRYRRLLPALWLCQLALSAGFLVYIHTHHGSLGDYGIGLRWQTPADETRAPYR